MAIYHIGISMAGAVSAGSYTAGVLTQLFETIDAWYEFKKKGIRFTTPDNKEISIRPEEMPKHKISIDALSGASAGGMCTALLAICLAEGKFDRLYDIWVNQIDLRPMLSTSDIKSSSTSIYSLLNVNIIDKIGEGITNFVYDSSKPWPSYLAEQIDMYLTLTNLKGVPFEITFNAGNTSKQIIHNFADFKRFTLKKPGSTNPVKEEDSTILTPETKTSSSNVKEWTELVNTCIASGAFPVGLKPRTLSRYKKEYDNREWYFPNPMKPLSKPVAQYFKANWDDGATDPMDFQYVDGGVMNNEPFELVRRRLALNQGFWRNSRNGNEAKSGVIMIDPFPSNPTPKSDSSSNLPEIQQLLPGLFNSLRNQALFSPDLLFTAMDSSIYSRFLISPTRSVLKGGKHEPAKVPLASSILGAFGGFISSSFRNHDYELGRRNCYDFLQKYFSLPLSNPIVSYVKDDDLINLYDKAGWLTTKPNSDGNNELHMQIIPVIPASALRNNTMAILQIPTYPEWPKIYNYELEELRGIAYERFEKILDVYIDKITESWTSERIFNIVVDKVFLNKKWFAHMWKELIEEELRKIEQLK